MKLEKFTLCCGGCKGRRGFNVEVAAQDRHAAIEKMCSVCPFEVDTHTAYQRNYGKEEK